MNLIQFLVLLLIAGIAGAIGRALSGSPTRGGCLVSIGLGFVGALLGSWLAGALGLPALLPIRLGGASFPLVWAIIGAALFVAVLGLISRAGR